MAKKAAKKSALRRSTAKTAGRKKAARKATARKAAKRAPARRRAARPRTAARGTATPAPIADVRGADLRRDIGGVRLEVGRAGAGRIKRMIYPPGYEWATHTKPFVDTDYCMHAHVGFLVQGRIDVEYADGCVEVYEAPHIVVVAPGHHGHVVGDEPAVLIEFDFEGETVERFGMPDAHRHE